MTVDILQDAKQIVRDFYAVFDGADSASLESVLSAHTAEQFLWRGMHPFYEQSGAADVARVFWGPLRNSFTNLQRRQDIFMAGQNNVDDQNSVWVASMGHFIGLFDKDWIGIPATGKIAYLRYAEFSRVEDGVIQESALFCDVIGVMQQAGHDPLPPQTGASFMYPGPMTHDGLLLDPQDTVESEKTMSIVSSMIDDLSALNQGDDDRCPPELLARTWHDDMLWYGPAGIGATFTIPRYQQQHQYPFRTQLKDKVFNGHIARFAEGSYAGFFGWANLTNTPTGGFLGLPGSNVRADMRVVDIYRRDGDKLAENWVFIDLLHYLSMQGLDVLGRLRQLRGAASL